MSLDLAYELPWKPLDIPFDINSNAEISIIDPELEWIFSESHIKSRSKNSPMLGMKFKGKVIGTMSGTYIFENLPIIT